MKYIKKPIPIDAVEITENIKKIKMPVWLVDALEKGIIYFSEDQKIFTIKTLEGLMTGAYGDYIIKGIKEELYCCKRDIFENSYVKLNEAVETDATESAHNQIKGLSTGVEVSSCDVETHGNVIYYDENHARIAELQQQNDKFWDAMKELHNKVEEMNKKKCHDGF